MRHYDLKPTVWHADPWAFDWDEESGVVTGRNAEDIKKIAAFGGISAHPQPWSVDFSAEPLRSKSDMAAIIGWEHELPDDLAPHYPRLPGDGIPDVTYITADNVVVIGRDQIVY